MEPKTSVTLSVVTIARNEQRDLPGFIANFGAFADEVVIVDDQSTDETAAIAQKAGAKVKLISAPATEQRDFSRLRNLGTTAATGEWALHVDVDMRATPELAQGIREAIQSRDYDAFIYPVRHFFLNQPLDYSGFQNVRKLWLMRTSAGQWQGRVHEQLVAQLERRRIGKLSAKMWHFGDINIAERLEKNICYSALEAQRARRKDPWAILVGGLVAGLRESFRSYVLRTGFRDGRVGFAWALYLLAGTINRHLMIYDTQEHRPNEERQALEEELASRMLQMPSYGADPRR